MQPCTGSVNPQAQAVTAAQVPEPGPFPCTASPAALVPHALLARAPVTPMRHVK